MTGWIIFFVILAILLFLLVSRIKVELCYDQEISLTIRYLFLRFPLLPSKQTDKKKNSKKATASSPKKERTPSDKTKQPKRNHKTVDLVFDDWIEKASNFMTTLRSILHGVNFLLRHVVIDHVRIRMHIGGEDPAQAGISYGKTCIFVYTGLAALQNYLNIKVERLELIPEMMKDVFDVKASLRVCIPVYIALWAAIGAFGKLLMQLIKKQMGASKEGVQQTEGT